MEEIGQEKGTIQREYQVSVRSLVEFILRNGDIDHRVPGTRDQEAMLAGSRLHRKIQGKMGSDYEAEVPLSITIPGEAYRLVIQGRADGIITPPDEGAVMPVCVDEIKCMYQNVMRLKEPYLLHKAQAMCYAFMYGIRHDCMHMEIQITYCNIETEEIRRFRESFSMETLTEWFTRLTESYQKWITFHYEHEKKRQASIAKLTFPYPYREGQRELVRSVYLSISRKHRLFIQAPTGIGKTLAVLFPAVAAMGQEKCGRIFYLTAKTIGRSVAEESFQLLRNEGACLSALTITAKEKVCPLEEMECNPAACERAKGHFDRVNEAIYDVLTHEEQITRQIIESYAAKHQVCPYEMSLDISNFVDAIICDYNYAFDPQARLKRFFSDVEKTDDIQNVFLIDEAHNLVDRAREMYSASLTREEIEEMCQVMEYQSRKIYRELTLCRDELIYLKRNFTESVLIGETEINALVLHLMRLYGELEEYLHEYPDFDGRKEVLNFYFHVSAFLDVVELLDEHYRIYCLYEENRFMVRLFCINPASNLRACMDKAVSTVLFSATLLPVNYYKKLLTGEKKDYAVYVKSPFAQENRLLFAATDVTSKYTDRGVHTYQRILEYIRRLFTQRKGNYMVFFPSYQLMNEVYQCSEAAPLTGARIQLQEQGMDEAQREVFLHQFEEQQNLIAFCTLGGIFSEGIDLVREKLIGCLVVGTGLPQICRERDIVKGYFEELGMNGFDYAYRYPGMNKVMQAAGRVIRTADDRGVIGLLDFRFLEQSYTGLFPREWADCKIVDMHNLEQVLAEFWEK